MPEGYVQFTVEALVGTIDFFHPLGNSLPSHLLAQLSHTIKEVSSHPQVRVIVLRSGGEGAFCGGASFIELAALENEAQGEVFFNGFAQVINALRLCPQLVVGRIQGKCVGGGVGLAAACDYAVAHQSAQIKLSELAVGIGPFVIGPAVVRKIGLSAFSQLAINATAWQTSQWAMQKGLFMEVHDTVAGLDDAVYQLAKTLAHSSPQAMGKLKEMLWQGTENWDTLLAAQAAISGRLAVTPFAKEAIAHFFAKKIPTAP